MQTNGGLKVSPESYIFKPFNPDEARLLKGKLKPAIYYPSTNTLIVLPSKLIAGVKVLDEEPAKETSSR